jgi:hypothetical protein
VELPLAADELEALRKSAAEVESGVKELATL